MDIFMTMFKPRPSQSPVRTSGVKRHNETPPSQATKTAKTNHHHVKHEEEDEEEEQQQQQQQQQQERPKFTFEQVKSMIEAMLGETEKAKRLLVNNGLKNFDFSQIAPNGHSPEQCKELIDRLVKNTRRVRTFNEVLNDIKDNLNRKTYTEIIQRATMDVDNLPRRPPSAYLLYHQDQYHKLKDVHPLAAEVSKIVAEQWKNLDQKKKKRWETKHNDLVAQYERQMEELGLVKHLEPKRPGTARSIYIQTHIEQCEEKRIVEGDDSLSKKEISSLKEKFGAEFDSFDRTKKSYWNKLARERSAKYKKECEEYSASNPHLKPKPITSSRGGGGGGGGGGTAGRPKKPDFPVPPRSVWKLYQEKKLPEGLEGKEAEETKEKIKRKFSELSTKKLLKFIKKALKDKDRYDQEVDEFLEVHPEYRNQLKAKDSKANLTKEQWKLYQTVVEHRPSLPAPNSYLYYCGKLLSDDKFSSAHAFIEPTQRMQLASQSWQSLSEEERSQYEREHAESIENYISEMNEWLEHIGPTRRREVLLEEPRSNPDYWRKRANRANKKAAKQMRS